MTAGIATKSPTRDIIRARFGAAAGRADIADSKSSAIGNPAASRAAFGAAFRRLFGRLDIAAEIRSDGMGFDMARCSKTA